MEATLLAEIWKRPDDAGALTVYADWLATHGDATRAEYIQLSLLARPTPAQNKRREALRKKHRGAWLGAARPFVWTWEESDETPGFVARAQCSMPKLAKGFTHVRALGPRLVVSISEPKAKREVAALAKLPLGTLWGIAMYENDAQWITDDLMIALAPAMRGLRSLALHPGEARSSDRGWAALLAQLDGLEHLELDLGDNPVRWLELLVASSLPRTLRSLSVPGWIDTPLRTRIAKAVPATEFRSEGRSRFNRETGYYES